MTTQPISRESVKAPHAWNAKAILRDRALFLEQGNSALERSEVREPIKASWRRSAINGLNPVHCLPQFSGAPRPNDQFRSMATRIVADEASTLPEIRMCLWITDHEGRLVRYWAPDARFERYLSSRAVLPGNSIAELYAGTGGGGMAIETGQPSIVFGPEHFSECWLDTTSAAAPVRHPVTRRVVGAIGMACEFKDSSFMLLGWVTSVAKQVERELTNDLSADEHLLLSAYLGTNHDARHPVICMDEKTVITNAVASRMLNAQDQAMLWEHVSRSMDNPAGTDHAITLSTGAAAVASLKSLFKGDTRVGAVISLRQADERTRNAAADRDVLPGLPGRSVTWRNAWSQFDPMATRNSAISLLIVGAEGAGKTTAAAAVLDGKSTSTIDLCLDTARDRSSWLTRLEDLRQTGTESVLIEHLEAVGNDQSQEAVEFFTRLRNLGLDVVGTMTTSGAVNRGRIDEMFDTAVHLPTLNDRVDDLGLLLDAMTRRHCPGRRPTWPASVVQTLSRTDWEYNLHSLDAVVRFVLSSLRGRLQVTVTDLPAHLRAQSSRRFLAGLEAAEADAIATALRQAHGNKRLAADSLGIARSTLYRKVRALGLDLTASTY